MDRTSRIVFELKQMIHAKELPSHLETKVVNLIKGVESRTINLLDYRKFNSKAKYGSELIDTIIEADKRQQEKLRCKYA